MYLLLIPVQYLLIEGDFQNWKIQKRSKLKVTDVEALPATAKTC